ncbi:MAG TPA: acyl carrier protein [Candidatus Polarisedimenticolia bacterium]|nr:acyl carrier protein [Candidatus Polarisedimenticolia bacterium]
MPDRERTRRDVMQVVADIADLPVERISEDATLESLGIDSLNGLRIVAEMERRYGINIPDEAIGKIRSMSDIFGLVDAHTPGE